LVLDKEFVIRNIKEGLNLRDYVEKMKDYAEMVGISLDELDLLLWSQKTGYVFK